MKLPTYESRQHSSFIHRNFVNQQVWIFNFFILSLIKLQYSVSLDTVCENFSIMNIASAPITRWRMLRSCIHVKRVAPQLVRSKRYEAFDANLDKDALDEARKWHSSFDPARLPAGSTTFARSSGPGGQHVNKLVLPS